MMNCDFIIIGGGIAGASAGYELSRHGHVVVLEAEDRAGYHTTGRSAAYFTNNYGNAVIRGLTKASKPFLFDPPDGFTDVPLVTDGGVLAIARADQNEAFEQNLADGQAIAPSIHEVPAAEAVRMCPVLRSDYVARAHLEPDAKPMDVDAIHAGFLRGLARRGGKLLCDARVTGLRRVADTWQVETDGKILQAPVVIDAAGAWGDAVAAMAGVAPIGLVPKRRTAIIFDAPEAVSLADSPMVIDVSEEFYFKPEAGKVLASPADETPSPPCDAQPEEIDIALTVDRIERATQFTIRRIEHKWAGLRSFVADHTLVAGAAPEAPGFVWLVGQGGYGIMTSPAMARAVAALATGTAWPADLAACGVGPEDLSPSRPGLAPITAAAG